MTARDPELLRPPAAVGEGDLHYLTAAAAGKLFAARELSPVELMEATIARIEDVDPVVNALPIRFFDQALAGCPPGRGALRAAGTAARVRSKASRSPSRTKSRWPASPAPPARWSSRT